MGVNFIKDSSIPETQQKITGPPIKAQRNIGEDTEYLVDP